MARVLQELRQGSGFWIPDLAGPGDLSKLWICSHLAPIVVDGAGCFSLLVLVLLSLAPCAQTSLQPLQLA